MEVLPGITNVYYYTEVLPVQDGSLCARKSPYALHPVSQKFPGPISVAFETVASVRLTDDDPPSASAAGIVQLLRGGSARDCTITTWRFCQGLYNYYVEVLPGIVQLLRGGSARDCTITTRRFCQGLYNYYVEVLPGIVQLLRGGSAAEVLPGVV